MAPSLFVRKSLTTLPMSKLDQSCGFSGLSPLSLHALRCLGSMSGPRPCLGSGSAWLLPPSGTGGVGAAEEEEDEEDAEGCWARRSASATLSSAPLASSSPSMFAGMPAIGSLCALACGSCGMSLLRLALTAGTCSCPHLHP